jgi:Zinc carboxypeptidase
MSKCKTISVTSTLVCWLLSGTASLYGQQAKTESPIENAFQMALIVQDTNGDQIADIICGHIIVPKAPSAAENTSAANLAARLGYETSALTLPIVVPASNQATKSCATEKANVWVGREALPVAAASTVDKEIAKLQIGEGGVFNVPGGLLIAGGDAVGLLSAADAYSARAPYQWSTQGEKLQGIAKTINARLENQKVAATVELVTLTYQSGQPGIHKAVLQVTGTADLAAVRKALETGEGESPLKAITAREIELRMADGNLLLLAGGGVRAGAATQTPTPAGGGGDAGTPRLLDLHELFGIHGLLTGNQKNLVPESVSSKLYVPAGEPGIAMANLAARLGLETTGITLPIALPDTGTSPVQVRSGATISGETLLTENAKDLLGAPGGTPMDKIQAGQFAKDGGPELPTLKAGEGELHVVDRAFGTNPALLVRGDAAGSAAAMDYASQHLPYLWEPSKKFGGLEEMRLDLAKFFSLRSSTGQATTALFLLDQWIDELSAGGKKIASANIELDVDESDPKLAKFIHDEIAAKLKTQKVEVKTGNLHAGTKCCNSDPDLHNMSLVMPFKQPEPTFRDDFTIPWEGKRMMDAVRKAAANMPRGQPAKLEVRVSEGPEERIKIKQQLMDLLKQAGADPAQTEVTVLCTYKSGYSWLVDEIYPMLKAKGVAKMKIEFAPYPDPTKQTTMRSLYRWNQELFPVDEVLAKDLQIPLKDVEIAKMNDDKGPTYKVHAYGADGKEILSREFTVKTVSRPYSDRFPEYETVTVETGWVNLTAGAKTLLDERVESDIEMFWDHYQAETLPRIFKIVMAQNEGKPRIEFQPLFDTLKVSYKMSEPDYQIGIEQERISSLEGLQEDTFFNTENFFYMMGDLMAGASMDYQGRIIPVSYPSRDGEDGEVHIEFYAKDAGFPKVRLAWKTDGDSVEHEKERPLAAVPSAGHMRLIAARVQAGKDSVNSLTWRMPVDFKKYNYNEWIVLGEKSRVDRTITSSDQAIAQVEWLQKMHAAGLYLDSLTYPHLSSLGFEFELPVPINSPEHAKKEIVISQLAVMPPATKRPMITDFKPTPLDGTGHFVQWDNPISPGDEEHLLSRLGTYPGVDVYWMGRTYLGRNIWAADMTLPTPSTLTSMPKATTLKASIIYSGRQHANEVSSTSHLMRLGEELVLDPKRRESLNKVNVILHPITNVDGAELSIDLAKTSPHNMLHPGYHASLTSDVTTAQNEEFPVYPESATRRLLWNAWLPDAFLNPHGYPTHEWVQPFSEYSAWITNRMGAETGRTNWVPRGWFTSLGYLGDDEHPESRTVTYALREKIVAEMAKTPGVLEMNAHENDRYERFQHWEEESYQQPIYKGVRINMALKGQDSGARGNTGASVGIGGLMVRYPEITYDDGYTEAPDETAYGDFLHLVASAGLAYDHAHLDYLTEGKLNIKRTQKDAAEGVTWQVERKRPILPLTPPPVPQAEGVKQ